MPGKLGFMSSAKTVRHTLAPLLANGLAVGLILASIAGETRLRLPFDVLPGAVYLALLSLPAFNWNRTLGQFLDGNPQGDSLTPG